MKRWLWAGIAVVAVLGLVAGGLVVVLTPDHHTTFLIDSSESADFREVADAVGSAASNMSADDALALRRFGGSCDSPNTEELVTPGTGQAAKIGDTARAITPGGKATLLSGILAAIDDFARTYPFRGSSTNRIVVVARGGADACGKNADEVRSIIKEHTDRAGVKIDFRFVGHKLTSEQAKVLKAIAEATDAQATRFTKDTTELVTTMKEVSVPTDLVAQEVQLPRSPCEEVTPESLMADRPQRANDPGVRLYYFDLECVQDRYLMAKLQSDPVYTDALFVVFERKDQKWEYIQSGTALSCGKIPRDVWKAWNTACAFEAVVCRDGEQKVTDRTGVGCLAAIDIADRYKAAIDARQAQGQGLFWEASGWSCSWPYEAGRAHVTTPLTCVRTSDDMVVQLGEYS